MQSTASDMTWLMPRVRSRESHRNCHMAQPDDVYVFDREEVVSCGFSVPSSRTCGLLDDTCDTEESSLELYRSRDL